MDKAEAHAYVTRRKGRVMAQILDHFETELQPLLPKEAAETFKAMVRRKLNAFATDVQTDVLGTAEVNGAARDLKDRLDIETGTKETPAA